MNPDAIPTPVSAALEWAKDYRNEAARCRTAMPDPKTQPVWYVLVTAYCTKCEECASDVERGINPKCGDELEELRSWLFELKDNPGHPFADSLVKHGFTFTETTEILDFTTTKGRPSGTRKNAKAFIDACEMKRKGATYSVITNQLCDCGKRNGHDKYCQENFRKGVRSVEKLVEKYSPNPGN